MSEIVAAPKDRYAKLRLAMATDLNKIPSKYLAMFYGDTGSGKTVYAFAHADALTEGRILYIDTGQGFLSLKNHPALFRSLQPKVTVLPFTGETQLLQVAEAIERRAPGFDFSCVIWDEGSSMLDKFTDVVTYGRSLNSKEEKDPNLPLLPDYAISGNKFRQAFDMYVQLPQLHFIVLSHFRYEKTTLGLDRTSPSFPPRVGRDIRRPLHTIAYLENSYNRQTKKYTRTIQVHTTDTCTAKTRVGGFADEPVTDPKKFLKATIQWTKGEIPTEEKEILAASRPINSTDPENDEYNPEGVEVE